MTANAVTAHLPTRLTHEPLGHWLRNCGNVRYRADITWRGQVGSYHGWCVFDTVAHGARAMMLDVRAQQARHGARTLYEVVARYAPASDGNKPVAYADIVGRLAHVNPQSPIDLSDPETLAVVAHAMSIHEIGGHWAPTLDTFRSALAA
ncbi:MAG: hypothetical protein OXF27_07575 [Acidobacteria bacterium]|nr:hypothetical protein [Acidobacteriota bacterium]